MPKDKKIHLKVKRQDGPDSGSYWEEFAVPYQKSMNVIALLMEIRKNPVNARGRPTAPVVWESSCLEEVCGACSMKINGHVRQACSALIDGMEQPICLEPMDKFPVVRDLRVDRTKLFNALKRVKAWIEIDGTYDLGPGPRLSSKDQQVGYELSRCMTCGCCVDACPQVNAKSPFIGAAAISQARLFNLHPTGAMHAGNRIDALLEDGGLESCGNAQNCVQVCPKKIPLTTSIAKMQRDATGRALKRLLF